MATTKKHPKSPSFIQFIKKHKLSLAITAGVLLVIYLIGLINPITGPLLRYPYYEAYCGKKPVIAGSFMGSRFYYTPAMKEYYSPDPFSEMFCTENDAVIHGYSSSRLYAE